MSEDEITFDPDPLDPERYEVRRGGDLIAELVWTENVQASRGMPEISEGSWILSRVGQVDGDNDEPLTEAHGKDDIDTAQKQATRLLAEQEGDDS